MNRFFLAVFVALFVSACGSEDNSPATDNIDLIVRCGLMIDGLSDEVSIDQLIVIREQRISEILPDRMSDLPDAEILDLSDHTCLPGLIDMHTHFDGTPADFSDYTVYLHRTREDTMRLGSELSRTTLESGFTTVRVVGAYMAWVSRDLRDLVRAGEASGPRMRIAGAYLTIPHGGGDMTIPGVEYSEIPEVFHKGVARGPDEFRARAQELVDGGADFLKIIASGAVFGHGSNPGAPEMTPEEIRAVVEVADAAGIKVTAHAHSAESIKDAILAGVSSIEHASLGDEESVELALEYDVAFSMDVYNGTYTAEVGEAAGYAAEFMQKNEDTTEAQRVVFRDALAKGVTLMFGTDLGVLPHHMGTRQFVEMVKQGMTPMHAIKSATSIPADHMELAADVGALQVGRYGDLIAVRGNPLEDISVLQNVQVVVKGGEVVSRKNVGQ